MFFKEKWRSQGQPIFSPDKIAFVSKKDYALAAFSDLKDSMYQLADVPAKKEQLKKFVNFLNKCKYL